MNISSVTNGSPVTRLHGSKAVPSSQGSQDVSSPPADTVEISDAARYLGEIQKLPEVRQDKVDAARQSLATGTLDTPEKLDVAVGRLIDDVR
jgi:uncharacterized protein (DUF885 family)